MTTMASNWIKRCVTDRMNTRIYLKNGKCLLGIIIQDDADAFILSGGQAESETLIYKDMIATIVRSPSDTPIR